MTTAIAPMTKTVTISRANLQDALLSTIKSAVDEGLGHVQMTALLSGLRHDVTVADAVVALTTLRGGSLPVTAQDLD